MAAKKKSLMDFVEVVSDRIANDFGVLNPAAFVAGKAREAIKPTQRVTPKLQADPNKNIMTTTTVQDAQGDSYFAPEGLEEIPQIAKGTLPVTRKQVAEYMINRELDAMPDNKVKQVMRDVNMPSDAREMALRVGGRKASEAGERTAAKAKAKSAGADLDDMAEMGRYRGKDKGGVTSGAAPTAPASPTRTRETLPSVDGPMRSISSGNRSIYDTMSKAEMGRDRAIGELSSDSAAMRSSAAASPDRDIDALFKKATGTTFDPKSRRDKAVRAELEAVLSSRPELADKSDTKVALAWYANKRKK